MSSIPAKKTKIVATLGPASSQAVIIEGLVLAGANVFRINMSHADQGQLETLVRHIRSVSERLAVPVGIIADLRGPRIRVGAVANGTITLTDGQTLVLTPESVVGTPERVSVSYPQLAADVQVGAELLIDDGTIQAIVTAIGPGGDVQCRVLRGGVLSSHRGINVPKRRLSLPALTDKDLADVNAGIALGVDFFALSFVQSAADVRQLSERITAGGGHQQVIAKIEREPAVTDIEAIARESFAVMIARGDLALEMSIEETPIVQKHVMTVCRSLDRPVITATQMLESMIQSRKPTRAEAADVANAILDGTDALMLSGETSIGVDPVNVVRTMTRIASRAEQAIDEGRLRRPPEVASQARIVDALAHASRTMAEDVGAALIVVFTTDGNSAIRVASQRPRPPILALCPDERVRRRVALVWGVQTRLIDLEAAADNLIAVATRAALDSGLARSGDTTVVTAGRLLAARGITDFVKIDRIP